MTAISGQLNSKEREVLTSAVLNSAPKPEIILEVGTWLGGGSTLHFLEALALNQVGHLYGVEADSSIYQQMLENLHAAVPDKVSRFTPLFGTSRKVIPRLLHQLGPDAEIDIVFLDGGDNPNEQVQEFQALANRIRVGGTLFAHDTKLRKGKWLLPYLKRLDNWNVCLLDISEEGMLAATKLRDQPSSGSRLFATIKLFTLRLEPVELIGAVLPKSICALFLRLLPDACDCDSRKVESNSKRVRNAATDANCEPIFALACV